MRLSLWIAIIAIMLSELCSAQTCDTPDHRAFDFWLGSWTVTNADGSDAGTNVISKSQHGCLVSEVWASAKGGFTGTSMNFFHPKKKRWQQLWIDNAGGFLELHGQYSDRQMILRSDDLLNDQGQTIYHQISWTANEDGSVRQRWDTFSEGKVINTVFDGLYKQQP